MKLMLQSGKIGKNDFFSFDHWCSWAIFSLIQVDSTQVSNMKVEECHSLCPLEPRTCILVAWVASYEFLNKPWPNWLESINKCKLGPKGNQTRSHKLWYIHPTCWDIPLQRCLIHDNSQSFKEKHFAHSHLMMFWSKNTLKNKALNLKLGL
jgi:hypothetical protein